MRSERKRHACRAAAALTLLLFAGCTHIPWTDRFAWSPDGRHAVVLADGLRVTDPSGRLSDVLLPGASAASWFPDSTRIAVAVRREVATFDEVARAIGAERTRELVEEAETLLSFFRAYWPAEESVKEILMGALWASSLDSGRECLADNEAALLYLRERHSDEVRRWYAENPEELDSATATLHSLVVARVEDDRVEIERTVASDVREIKRSEVSPDGRLVAFVTAAEEPFGTRPVCIGTWVVTADGTRPPELVAGRTGLYPTWKAGGRALLYLDSTAIDDSDTIGCLMSRDVVDASGACHVAEEPECGAQVLLRKPLEFRIGALPDGRIMFSSPRAAFPLIQTGANPRDRLFVLDDRPPARSLGEAGSAVLEGRSVFGFDVSPDGSRILISASDGQLSVLTVSDARHEVLPVSLARMENNDPGSPFAIWSGPSAITYVKQVGDRRELILRRGASETTLSHEWPDHVVNGLLGMLPPTDARQR
jgi:hypothetical protein